MLLRYCKCNDPTLFEGFQCNLQNFLHGYSNPALDEVFRIRRLYFKCLLMNFASKTWGNGHKAISRRWCFLSVTLSASTSLSGFQPSLFPRVQWFTSHFYFGGKRSNGTDQHITYRSDKLYGCHYLIYFYVHFIDTYTDCFTMVYKSHNPETRHVLEYYFVWSFRFQCRSVVCPCYFTPRSFIFPRDSIDSSNILNRKHFNRLCHLTLKLKLPNWFLQLLLI